MKNDYIQVFLALICLISFGYQVALNNAFDAFVSFALFLVFINLTND